MSTTPILPGFHPDPSICRVGEDYYAVTSSFEYLPGVPIFHSTDLVTWRQIGNVLDRDDQLVLPSSRGSGGIFAPTLRHHADRFWMITTNIDRVRDGHLIVTATDPAGPWSTPVYTTGAVGIDPDLFWDTDGTCVLTWAAPLSEQPIMQAVVDPETGRLLSAPHAISAGTGLAHPEGPHLLLREGWYHLLLAEGGTERGHAVTIARSRSVDGPFESNPANPILSHRSTTHPVQNTGHADLVETSAGGWAMVHLGVRPVGPSPGFHLNGRETFLTGIDWVDDWPVVDAEAFDVTHQPRHVDEDFSGELGVHWIAPGRHPRDFASAAGGGGIVLSPPSAPGQRSLLVHRVEDQSWEATADVDSGTGRLVLRLDDAHWAAVESRAGSVAARIVVGPLDQVIAETAAPDAATLTLVIRSSPPQRAGHGSGSVADVVSLGYLDGEDLRVLAEFDGRYLSTEVAGLFTGRVVGVEPLDGGDRAATVRSYTYRGATES